MARRTQPVPKARRGEERSRKRSGRGGSSAVEQPHHDRGEPLEEDGLPPFWGETRVVLLPVDPHSVHVYWELAPHDQVKVAQRLSRANSKVKPVLRFHETTGAHAPFDIDIELSAGKCYVRLASPEKSYRVELGLRGGRFVSLAHSNVVRTPAAGPSARREEDSMAPLESQSVPPGAGAPVARKASEGEAPGASKIDSASPGVPFEASFTPGAGQQQPAEREALEPETPSPIDFAEALQQKLAALYAGAQWPAPPTRAAPAGSQLFLKQPRPLRGFAGRDPAGMDLTDRNEASMAWGCSSGPAVPREKES